MGFYEKKVIVLAVSPFISCNTLMTLAQHHFVNRPIIAHKLHKKYKMDTEYTMT